MPYEIKTYKRESTQFAPASLKKIHPLGKSPLVEIQAPGGSQPLILAESANIVEYLTEHWGKWLIPKRYQDGKEGVIGGGDGGVEEV